MAFSEYLLYFLLFVVAFLYASVGHGGASGYLALMALFGFSAAVMKPTALLLNIVVSLVAFIQFYRKGYFRLRLFLPLALVSVPFAFLGGLTPLEDHLYRRMLGVLLIVPAIRFTGLFKPAQPTSFPFRILPALIAGSVIGYISGLTGIGGGILLSPLLLMAGWTDMKQTAALSAAFIFVNSLAGLGGSYMNGLPLSTGMAGWAGIALCGGLLGSYVGATRFNHTQLSYVLATVLFIASFKLLFF